LRKASSLSNEKNNQKLPVMFGYRNTVCFPSVRRRICARKTPGSNVFREYRPDAGQMCRTMTYDLGDLAQRHLRLREEADLVDRDGTGSPGGVELASGVRCSRVNEGATTARERRSRNMGEALAGGTQVCTKAPG